MYNYTIFTPNTLTFFLVRYIGYDIEVMNTHIQLVSAEQTKEFGYAIGTQLKGGECIELVGDIGAGKTTFVKGLAEGMGVKEVVQSPSFTISQQYKARHEVLLCHYDLYRLTDPGLATYDLAESLQDPRAVTVIEWAQSAEHVLPTSRITITLSYDEQEGRLADIKIPDEYNYISLKTN